MKRVFFILLVCNTYSVLSQTPQYTQIYDCDYSGLTRPPLCYLENNDVWKTSHGSPCYYDYMGQGFYNQLLLTTQKDNTKPAQKSEGIFTPFTFYKDCKYRIAIGLFQSEGQPNINVYAANGLSDNKKTDCTVADPPSINDKKLIGENSAICNLPYYVCSYYFPDQNSFFIPDKNYSQFWLYSSQIFGDTGAVIIDEIVIMYYGPVIPPYMPGSLSVASVGSQTVTVGWNPSTKGDFNVKEYKVYCGNNTYTTTSTQYIISNLAPCTDYSIEVEAVDILGYKSPKAMVNIKTTPDGNVVLSTPINLSTQSNKKYVVAAKDYIQFNPGFGVTSNTTGEYFQAIIGECP